jgi:hypothetical protein
MHNISIVSVILCVNSVDSIDVIFNEQLTLNPESILARPLDFLLLLVEFKFIPVLPLLILLIQN